MKLWSPPLSGAVSLFLLGGGTLAITLGSLATDDVSYARTRYTAVMAMLLAAPVLVDYARRGGLHVGWRRSLWAAALVAYLLHFRWAVFGTYLGDFSAIAARQGWVAYSNYAVTIVWAVDVAASCWAQSNAVGSRALRFVAWASVTVSFIVAAAVFRTGFVQLLGVALGASVLVALVIRWWSRGTVVATPGAA